ncbi:MAG TPA: hypothetical protein V6C97_18465 [Oculatellaceae cyanobacterium]
MGALDKPLEPQKIMATQAEHKFLTETNNNSALVHENRDLANRSLVHKGVLNDLRIDDHNHFPKENKDGDGAGIGIKIPPEFPGGTSPDVPKEPSGGAGPGIGIRIPPEFPGGANPDTNIKDPKEVPGNANPDFTTKYEPDLQTKHLNRTDS